jgi:tryptophan halogenase
MNAMTDGKATYDGSDRRIRKVVIVGGGTAGWMAASALRAVMPREMCRIVLVESDEIATVGVGEATIPPIHDFNRFLGLDENDFVRNTQASFKLAIQYVDWSRIGHSYFNPLGALTTNWLAGGPSGELPPVYRYLVKLAVEGKNPDLDAYSPCSVAAQRNRFARPKNNSQDTTYSYAFHFDASLYAKYLRAYAEARGVERVEGKVADAVLRPTDGFIDAVVLESGQRIEGELFIDCSGFRSLLAGQALKVPYEDWTHWLPCDRALAVPCESAGPLLPYTRSTAREAGWQWRIPLQHRTGNGYVFSSKFISEDKAADTLLANLDGPALDTPRLLKFTTGRRKEAWTKNCVTVGLSSGFMEPLESTSLHLIQEAILRLIKLFPERDCGPLVVREYNQQMAGSFDSIRDFIVLHYHATEREDTAFWRYCKYMSVPETLRFKMETFRRHGFVPIKPGEQFAARPWLSVMYGQGIQPQSYPPLMDTVDGNVMGAEMAKLRSYIQQIVGQMPSHEDFIKKNCSALPVAM